MLVYVLLCSSYINLNYRITELECVFNNIYIYMCAHFEEYDGIEFSFSYSFFLYINISLFILNF